MSTHCREHDWQPLFEGPEGEADLHFDNTMPYAASQFRRCSACKKFGVLRLTGVAVLSTHEVEYHAIEWHMERWEELLKGMPRTIEKWRDRLAKWEAWLEKNGDSFVT